MQILTIIVFYNRFFQILSYKKLILLKMRIPKTYVGREGKKKKSEASGRTMAKKINQ